MMRVSSKMKATSARAGVVPIIAARLIRFQSKQRLGCVVSSNGHTMVTAIRCMLALGCWSR